MDGEQKQSWYKKNCTRISSYNKVMKAETSMINTKCLVCQCRRILDNIKGTKPSFLDNWYQNNVGGKEIRKASTQQHIIDSNRISMTGFHNKFCWSSPSFLRQLVMTHKTGIHHHFHGLFVKSPPRMTEHWWSYQLPSIRYCIVLSDQQKILTILAL